MVRVVNHPKRGFTSAIRKQPISVEVSTQCELSHFGFLKRSCLINQAKFIDTLFLYFVNRKKPQFSKVGLSMEDFVFIQFTNNVLNNQNRHPARSMVTGKVSTHADRIFRMVPTCRFRRPPCATIVPATPDDKTWVVLTGSPK